MTTSQENTAFGASTGPIAWMVHNRVTPNLLMLVLLIGGFFMSARIKQEVFPEFQEDIVSITVGYRGASPEEVEQGIILAIEEGVRAIEGVKEITAIASEGSGQVNVELLGDANHQKAYQDIKQAVDRIVTFPKDAEEPEVSLEVHRREVLSIQLYGEVSEWSLRNLAEEVRDRLLQSPEITQVDLLGTRDYEVHVEVSQENLRVYGLTLQEIAQKIGATSVEIPGGGVKTQGGEILVRFKERRDWANEFGTIPIVTTSAGTVLKLADIAQVREGFHDVDAIATYDGQRAIGIGVFRIGAETPIGISDAVHRAMAQIEADLPPGVHYTINRDRSETYRQRLHLLLKNAFWGLSLVLLLLGLFLEYKVAFWVTMGIPTSFLGALLFLPGMGVTINMISMFAFIIALGIVVDDAIVAGENIYEYRQQGISFIEAAIRGARDVGVPVGFSILTNIVAFLPLYFIPGAFGKVWEVIPLVVITVFLISWVEAIFILPAHLGHARNNHAAPLAARLYRWQLKFSQLLSHFIEAAYRPFLNSCLHWRFFTVAVSVALLVGIAGYVLSGRMGMILMPRVESDFAVVTAALPYGSPLFKVEEIRDRLVAAAREVANEHGGERLVEGIFAVIQQNQVEVTTYLSDPDLRPLPTAEVTRLWRERVGEIPGLESLQFVSDRGGPGSGAAITVELSHRYIDVLDQASSVLAERMLEFPNTKDINDGYTPGKEQLDFKLKPEGRSLGLTSQEVARQVRNAFYGAEALRQQRGRNEVRVLVRLPESQRVSEYHIENLLIRTPSGRDVPLLEIAEMSRGRSYTSINRRNGRRTVTVTADVEPIDKTSQVMEALNTTVLPELMRDYPGLTFGYEGRQADMKESVQSLLRGLALALLCIYFLLAIPFRSYSQPVIVMVSIPFGIVGAVLGHLLMGYNLSVMSLMGIVALAGVVVNDSLVLINYANKCRQGGQKPHEALLMAGIRRFRPIVLTTLTTFGGLSPMIFESSRQARFMIPMALSLGYGILFATLITLLLVPCLYLIVVDAERLFRRAKRRETTGLAVCDLGKDMESTLEGRSRQRTGHS